MKISIQFYSFIGLKFQCQLWRGKYIRKIYQIRCFASRLPKKLIKSIAWMSSHAGLPGSEFADELARNGCEYPDEGVSRIGKRVFLSCVQSSLFSAGIQELFWYSTTSKRTPLWLDIRGGGSFSDFPCPFPISPGHQLECMGLSLGQLSAEQDFVCDSLFREVFWLSYAIEIENSKIIAKNISLWNSVYSTNGRTQVNIF